ncbi:MAG: hypothetical protein DCC68_22025 [Planctomycetota bacterium]|nr:MAG: hypothetical protein DCC68_22025 [Planctomycetota bacterium]
MTDIFRSSAREWGLIYSPQAQGAAKCYGVRAAVLALTPIEMASTLPPVHSPAATWRVAD